MTTLIIDIETRPDPSMGVYKNDPDAFPPPPYHMVTTVAWLTLDMGSSNARPGEAPVLPSASFGVAQGELYALREVARILASKPRVVTFNGRRFDLPVIAMRSMKHGIPQRALLGKDRGIDYLYRYRDDHCDVMDALSLSGAGVNASQHDVARMLGLPGKHVGSGDGVGTMTPEQEAAYCLDDVAQLALIYCEWRRLNGVEVEPVRDLILGAIEAEPRLSALHAALVGREEPTHD